MTYRIAIVGPKETVQGFTLLGVDVIALDEKENVMDVLMELKRAVVPGDKGADRTKYAIVFVTEDLVSDLSRDEQRKLARGALPAIIPLPSHAGSTGFGLKRLKTIVEQAVGSDILQ